MCSRPIAGDMRADDPIDTAGLTESVRDPAAGAVVLFLGTVRELTDGRRTLALDYEAYPEMATAKMQEIVETAQRKWPISSAGIVHRLGHLELGDVSVAVAVSCPHRVEAFEAGKYLIDTLKEIKSGSIDLQDALSGVAT